VDPRHAFNLASYARLLAYSHGDNETADIYFRRAVAADLGDSAILDFYIDFLYSIRETEQRSNEYFKGAINEFPQVDLSQRVNLPLKLWYTIQRVSTHFGECLPVCTAASRTSTEYSLTLFLGNNIWQCAPLLQLYGEYLDEVLGDAVEAARYFKLASEIVTL